MTGVYVALIVSALILAALFHAAPSTRAERRAFDLAPAWLGPGVRGVATHRASPDPGRDWFVA